MTSCTPVPLAYKSVDPKDGVKDKAPILFLHGMGGSKEHWDNLSQTVADATRRKVYAIDARNHGDSEWSDTFNLDVHVDDLLHFMDTMNILKAVLVGHSMGGITAIKTAMRAPDRVERIVVEDFSVNKQFPPALLNTLLGVFPMMVAALEQIPVGVDEQTAEKCFIENWKKSLPPETEGHVNRTEIPMRLKQLPDGRYTFQADMKSCENAMRNWDDMMTEPEGMYEGPACFIYGKRSEFRVDLDEENNKQFFPKAEFVGIENATHNVHFDCLEEFTDVLLKFLQRE